MLIEGETGTGKELVARVIQGIGDRVGKPFVTVNCGAIPANLVESTLFGHKKGAFTGAVADQPGKIQPRPRAARCSSTRSASCRSPPRPSCCALMQEGEIEPVGARAPSASMSASSRPPTAGCSTSPRAAHFREDLYYRLNVFPIVPAAAARPARRHRARSPAISSPASPPRPANASLASRGPALDLLRGYDWPGNIRQLENALYRAIVLSDGGYLEIADFPQIVAQARGREEDRSRLTSRARSPSGPVHIDAVRPSPEKVEAREAVPDRFLDRQGRRAAARNARTRA